LITPISVSDIQSSGERTKAWETRVRDSRDTIAAVDPGIRNLASVYSPQGRVQVIGDNANKVADNLLRKVRCAKKRMVQGVSVILDRTKRAVLLEQCRARRRQLRAKGRQKVRNLKESVPQSRVS
jgi:hypothetical protein